MVDLGSDALLVVRAALTASEVEALRAECDACLQAANLSADELCERSCAIDLFEDSIISDTSTVRTCRSAYLEERWRQLPALDHDMRNTVERVIFNTFPGILQAALRMSSIYLFNEHYIVKPAKSDLEFSWHIDEEKQLGCLTPDEKYITIWCTLDDASETNGTLIIPHNTIQYEAHVELDERSPSTKRARTTTAISMDYRTTTAGLAEHSAVMPIQSNATSTPTIHDSQKGIPVLAGTGTAVIFTSKLLHCSGQNRSHKARRVFYAQYSATPIGGVIEPLNFAVLTEPSEIILNVK